MLDFEYWASGSILTEGNILLLFFCFHVVKPLKSIMALLPTLFNYEKTRLNESQKCETKNQKCYH